MKCRFGNERQRENRRRFENMRRKMSFSKKHGRRRGNIRRKNINLLAKFRRFAKGAEFAACKPHFANGAKFTAHKFAFLQAIGKFYSSQAAPNFKI